MKNKHLHSKRTFYSVLFILLLNVAGMTKMYASYDFSAVCETGQTLYYNITDTENHYVELTYPGTNYNGPWNGFTKPTGDMVLPENVQFDGLTYSVTSIGDHVFSYCNGLTSIEIPNSVTSIGNYAFGSCSGLTSIEIPNSVTSIGNYAFNRCSGLVSIEIPNSVTSIGSSAFFLCSSLTSIEIPNSVTSIGSYVFEDCSSLTSIEIPNSVISIGAYAFAYCSGLTTIEIPNSVTSIGSSAFFGCVHLTSIEIPTSLTIIENSTFSDCRGLTSVEIPNSVTSIGSSAFRGCSGLTSLTFGNSVTSIGDDAFEICYGLVYYMGDIHQWCNIQFGNYSSNPLCYAHNLFIDNELVTDLVIPETVTEIKPYAFYGATCLTSLTIPNSVTSIGNSAFSNCSGLTLIEMPNSVTSIGNSAFYNCSGLITIEIPNSVISIGNSVFSGCSGLTTIEIPSSVTSIDNYAFYNCSGLTEVHYLGDVVEWCNIQFGDSYSNPLNYAHNLFINNAMVTDLVIPETITEIKPYAFYGATCLATLTISNSVTSIDSHAFSGCSGLASLTIPDSVTSIGEYAFSGCRGLTSLTLGNSVTSIGYGAFYNCYDILCITSFAETPPSLDNISSFSTFYNVSKAVPFCVPCGSEDEYASLSWGGFNNFYGICGGTVTVIANPEEGMVTGDGTFEAGQTCTVTATAMEGYTFAKWTLNGVMISNRSEFTFYVSGDMTLMAHFVPNGNIVFADFIVKSICVSNWDINGDDELSYSEAAAVLSLESRFAANSEITSFDELQYFIGLISIGGSAFNGCSGLTSIVLPNSITSIGSYAFQNCSGLTGNLTIPNSVTTIGSSAFRGCSGFKGNLTIGNSVTSIDYYAFLDCSGFTGNLTLGNSVTSIGHEAFYGCSGFTSMTVLADNPPTLSYNVFDYVNKSIPVSVPCGGVEAYTMPRWGGFYNISGLCGGMVTVAANPEEGGMVTGGGIIGADESCTVIANANEGYAFAIWTRDGIMVTTDAEYTFYVPSDMNLVAHFVPDANITFADANVKAICVAHWDTNGDGELSYTEAAVVTSLENVFSYNTSILTFDEFQYFIGLTSIGNEAFCGCNSLISIKIPNSVTSIGISVFSSCSSLTSITVLADNPPTLGYDAFYNVNKGIPVYVLCGSVEAYTTTHWGGFNNFIGFCGGTISVAANPEEGGFVSGGGIVGADEICTVTANENEGFSFAIWTRDGVVVSSDAEYTFYVSGDLSLVANFVPNGNITFADANVKSNCINHWDTNGDGELSYAEAATVTNLGEAFCSDTLISSFNELQYFIGLASIGNYAFRGCSSLTSIEIPNSVTSIGSYAFNNCSDLTSIEIPQSVTSISRSAFEYCIGLEQIIVDSGNTVYDSRENCNAIINTSTNELMIGCKNTVIPNSVTSIGSYAFSGCNGLTSIEIPNSVISIGSYAFRDCSSLNFIEIPNTVTSIGSYAFYSCSGMAFIGIPNSVTSINNYTFSYCTGLTSIEIPNSVTSIGNYAFNNCSSLEQIIVDSGNTVYDSRENCNAIINTSTNELMIGCKNTVIPNTVTSIGNYAFSYCYGLTSIVIPNSVVSIKNSAFYNCISLTSITVLAETPPTLGSIAFLEVDKSIPVYVPCFSSEAYQNTARWNEFTNYIEMCEYTITATANPTEGGTVTGAGTYIGGELCTLTATANIGYAFDYWVKDGVVISSEATYSFTVTESATYVAHFIEIQVLHFITAGNWSETSNWQGGALPGIHDEVFIDAPCQLDMNATLGALTISDGQSLTLQSGKTLNVMNTLTNTANTGLIIEDGAQLIHASENVSATVKKTIVGHGITGKGNYYLISNPLTSIVNPELASIYHITRGNYDFYDWLASAPDSLEWRNYKANDFMMFPDGYGYLYANQNGVELNFPGILRPSHNRFVKAVSYDSNDTEHPGWNLIGNPFACNACLVDENNEPLPCYRMNALGNGFVAVTPGTAIAPMEGVFYQASGNGIVYFIRTDNVIQPQVPTGAINGKFTINDNGDQVYFSQGNLQYIGSASTPYWKFADNQWDCLGYNGQDGIDQNVDRDLFGWGTSGNDHGSVCYQPWSTSETNSDYYAYGQDTYNLYDQTGQADWGYNPINNGGNQAVLWRTLTGNSGGEWNYIFNIRSASTVNGVANARYAKAKVNNVQGVILFPDSYTHPSGIAQPVGINEAGNTGWNGNNYSAAEFVLMEQQGMIFLPVAGRRYGTSVNIVDSGGFYWSASCSGNDAYNVYFNGTFFGTNGYCNRYFGQSVRLVCPAEN